MHDPSAGEIGGLFAGLVGLVVAVGHGLKWWLGWTDRRASTRAAKLDAWHRELDAREARLDAEQKTITDDIKLRVASLEAERAQFGNQIAALLGGYQLLAAEVRAIKPDSDALRRADELLRSAFPVDPTSPAGMIVLLGQAKRKDEGGSK